MLCLSTLLLLLTACTPEEPRSGSLPIEIREPRETVAASARPELAGINAANLLGEVVPRLENLLAKYEIAVDRYEVVVAGDELQTRRAELRELTNGWYQLATDSGLSVPPRIPADLYATTAALEKIPAPDFQDAFRRAVDRERRQIADLLAGYNPRGLPADFAAARRQLLTAMR